MYYFISIDYQNDFCSKGGKFYRDRPCQKFIAKELIPFLQEHDIKIAEIISDYRLPRPNETEAYCIPGTSGYESAIPKDVKLDKIWIKSMNSPDWVRENAGNSQAVPGKPYQDANAFTQWLEETIGKPNDEDEIILFGLTLDCCVLCTAQQLYFRGYKVRILKEATDISNIEKAKKTIKDNIDYKDFLFSTTHGMWSKPIAWDELSQKLQESLLTKQCSR